MSDLEASSTSTKATSVEAEGNKSSITSSSDGKKSSGNKSKTSDKSGPSLVKRTVPFNIPVNPIKRQEFNLTSQEQEKYNEVLKYFQSKLEFEYAIPDTSKTHILTDVEKSWLTKECFLRYLNATKWKVDQAIKRIEETLIWRRSFGLVSLPNHQHDEFITSNLVESENLTGKNLIIGYDNDNRPCLLLRNGYQNTKPLHRQVQHLVFMLERVIQFMPPGQDKLALMTDFKLAPPELKLSAKFPSISISKSVLHILQHHYPERLGKGLFTNIPWIGYTFFKLVGPFIDPYTRSKTIYDQPFENFVPYEQLDKEFNGGVDFEYIHEEYWVEMNNMGDRKWNNYLTNFEKLGKKIGLSEYDLRLGYDR